MLVNLQTILADTREKKYAVGLFNCVTLEMTKGIIAAAEELNSPVIIGPGESLLPGATLAEYADMMLGMAKRAKVPVCLHFDHGFNPDLVEEAIRLGYTSVMYDCSMLPFEENIRRTRDMVAKAHAYGCSLEAEIGHVGSNGSAEEAINQSIYTQPGEALEFAANSGCDALAVAIGTAHGVYIQMALGKQCVEAITEAAAGKAASGGFEGIGIGNRTHFHTQGFGFGPGRCPGGNEFLFHKQVSFAFSFIITEFGNFTILFVIQNRSSLVMFTNHRRMSVL